jgi:S-adenosyl methyltransferase
VPDDLTQGPVPEGVYEPRELDTSVPHIARIYDYWLGGKDNYAVDRQVAEQMSQVSPHIAEGVRANRAFLARSVRCLAEQEGIRQFLDIGTGLPSPDNTHEVAQSVAPETRVVYTDNDRIVLAHARALLTSGPQGITTYVEADLRDPGKILDGAAELLDFTRPVAVLLLAVLHVIGDDEDPYAIVARLMAPLPPGSFLVISHGATDIEPEMMAALAARLDEMMPPGQRPAFRDRAAVARFFDGLDLIAPGVVPITRWRPVPGTAVAPGTPVPMWGAVGRKPGQATLGSNSR